MSPASGAIEKTAREIKLSVALSNVVASILPISYVIFPLRWTSVWDELSNTFSFKQHPKTHHGWSYRMILAVTGLPRLQMTRSSEVCTTMYTTVSRAVWGQPSRLKANFLCHSYSLVSSTFQLTMIRRDGAMVNMTVPA